MLKRLLDLMAAAEAGCGAVTGKDVPSLATREKPSLEDYERAVADPGYMDFGVVFTHAVLEGVAEERAFALGSSYAAKLAEGMSKAYSIVYATAHNVACFIVDAPEEWARSYAQAYAYAVAAQESIGFAAAYGHAVADGALPEDALAFARRYAV